MRYFDYEKIAMEAGVPGDTLDTLREKVRQEFPKDDMMYELHLLRVCMALKDKRLSLEDALKPDLVSRS